MSLGLLYCSVQFEKNMLLNNVLVYSRVQYNTVYSTVLYCTVLYEKHVDLRRFGLKCCTVQYSTVLYCTVLQCIPKRVLAYGRLNFARIMRRVCYSHDDIGYKKNYSYWWSENGNLIRKELCNDLCKFRGNLFKAIIPDD